MATQASVFYFFMTQVLVLMTMTRAHVQLDVHQSDIAVGISASLGINCSFFSSADDHQEMESFSSLVLSKANSSGVEFEELAAITQFSPVSVDVLTDETVTATGIHSQTGETFLYLEWDYPTAAQAGVYQCVARGVDRLGDLVEEDNSTTVTAAPADLNDVFEKVKQMDKHITDVFEGLKHLLEKHSSDLEDTLATLQRFHPMAYIGNVEHHYYYISKQGYSTIDDAIMVCKSLGGYLAEVGSENEFNAIKNLLGNRSDFKRVMIAGTDKASDGTWVLQSTNSRIGFTRWAFSAASTGTDENCLGLIGGSYSWNMDDYPCSQKSPTASVRFMCEIPTV